MTNRVIRTGSMLGFGLGAIKEQFKTPDIPSKSSNNGTDNNSNNGLKGIISRAKSFINPVTNLSDEKDYNGNINPIRDVMTPPEENNHKTVTTPKSKIDNKDNISNGKITPKSVVKNVASAGFKGTKAYLSIGAKMAEGDFSSYKYKKQTSYNNKNKSMQNTEYLNNINSLQKGAENEFKGKNEEWNQKEIQENRF